MLQEGSKKTDLGLCYGRNHANILRVTTKTELDYIKPRVKFRNPSPKRTGKKRKKQAKTKPAK